MYYSRFPATRLNQSLSIQVLITNGNLELVDEGIQYVIKTEKEVLDGYAACAFRYRCLTRSNEPAWINGVQINMARYSLDHLISISSLTLPTRNSQSGLTKACLESPHTRDFVASEVLKYIKTWIPQPKIGVLTGSSVHADRAFLVEEMPEIVDWLHYRSVSFLLLVRCVLNFS